MPSVPSSDTEIITSNGRSLRLRAIRPGDAAALVEMGQRSTPDDLRLRFFGPVRAELGHLSSLLANVDQERDFVVAAYDPIQPRRVAQLLGVVRLIRAADESHGEFAIMVRSDMQGQGLGYRLMQAMLGWARQHGVLRVDGEVLHDNAKMLRMVKACGGVIVPKTSDFSTVAVAFDLAPIGASTPTLVDH